MDTFSHALWGYGLFGYKRYAWLALFFGAMPDLISFGLFMAVQVASGGWHWHPGPPPLASLPHWLFLSYDVGHSFVICFSVIGLVALWRRDIAFAMLGWPFHIVLDFPFHSLKYFPTPMLWPISDFHLDGVPWSNWYIWYPNIAGLIILFWYRRRQNKALQK
jgi:hypothetical protein